MHLEANPEPLRLVRVELFPQAPRDGGVGFGPPHAGRRAGLLEEPGC